MGRLLLDSSCLIALAKVGGLGLLDSLPTHACTTETALTEATVGEYPETGEIQDAVDRGGLDVLGPSATASRTGDLPRLGPGERSLLGAYEDDDLLVLDDGSARRHAEVKGYSVTGTLGLLIAATRQGVINPGDALDLLDRLSDTDFRMSVDLYRHARTRIQRVQDQSPG